MRGLVVSLVAALSFGAADLLAADPCLVPVIPRPSSVSSEKGAATLEFGPSTGICAPKGCRAAAEFQEWAKAALGWELKPCPGETPGALSLLQANDGDYGDEGYSLVVSPNGITVMANGEAGWFYATQTLRQLLTPTAKEAAHPSPSVTLPCIGISDRPRFSWRGLMLDESRHFFGKEKVKQLLDQMALHKLNRFHWHLTDEPGWRLEIKKYPALTTVGGLGEFKNPAAPCRYYTQDDIREIVSYAAARHIVIIPEIDMPGHASAANRAYPENSGGGSDKLPDFTFNPARPGTLAFLDDVLAETATLFPGPWIHYGADEVSFGNKRWPELTEVQALMKQENFKTTLEVEHWFNRRMAASISKLNRTTVGWDEIADAGIDPKSAVVMWWRHDKPAQLKKALELGHQVVLCPRIPCYFDFVQHESHRHGRRWGGFSSLDLVYAFPDLQKLGVAEERQKQLLGIEACVWTETIGDAQRLDFMVYPRLSALAEAAWTGAAVKDYADFQKRLKPEMLRLHAAGIYAFNPFDPKAVAEPPPKKIESTNYLDKPSAKP